MGGSAGLSGGAYEVAAGLTGQPCLGTGQARPLPVRGCTFVGSRPKETAQSTRSGPSLRRNRPQARAKLGGGGSSYSDSEGGNLTIRARIAEARPMFRGGVGGLPVVGWRRCVAGDRLKGWTWRLDGRLVFPGSTTRGAVVQKGAQGRQDGLDRPARRRAGSEITGVQADGFRGMCRAGGSNGPRRANGAGRVRRARSSGPSPGKPGQESATALGRQ